MSGQNTSTAFHIALAHSGVPDVVHGAGVEIALNAEGAIPEWIMILPAGKGGVIETVDGRGPYRMKDAAQLAVHSMQSATGGQITLDENHSTDLAAPKGEPAPARGWIVELQARADGVYGRVDWTGAGKALMSDRSYRFVSPVLAHDKAGNIIRLLRASLTNVPNLRGMAALHAQENSMDLLAQLRKLLGLADDADEAAVVAKINGMHGTGTAMQSIAKAAGLDASAPGETILATVTTLATAAKANSADTITALQSEIRDLGTRLQAAQTATATEKATAFVDSAIRNLVVGVKPMREHYISRHAASPEGAAAVEKEIGALPKLGPGATLAIEPPAPKDGMIALNAAQAEAARLLGIKPEDYAKTLAAEAAAS